LRGAKTITFDRYGLLCSQRKLKVRKKGGEMGEGKLGLGKALVRGIDGGGGGAGGGEGGGVGEGEGVVGEGGEGREGGDGGALL